MEKEKEKEKKSKSSKGFTKEYEDGNIKIIIGIMDKAIKIIARDEIEVFKGQIDLYTLQEKDRYFKMYDKIEDAYEDILTSFAKDKYELIKEENHLIINVDIEVNFKKSVISFILEKKEIQSEDLTKSLYQITHKYIRENYGLKNEILSLKEKINNIEENNEEEIEEIPSDYIVHPKTEQNLKDLEFNNNIINNNNINNSTISSS